MCAGSASTLQLIQGLTLPLVPKLTNAEQVAPSKDICFAKYNSSFLEVNVKETQIFPTTNVEQVFLRSWYSKKDLIRTLAYQNL